MTTDPATLKMMRAEQRSRFALTRGLTDSLAKAARRDRLIVRAGLTIAGVAVLALADRCERSSVAADPTRRAVRLMAESIQP